MEVFHQHDEGPLTRQRLHELDPGIVEAVPGHYGMEVTRDVQPERDRENLPLAEKGEDPLGRIAVEDAEVLLEDLAREVGT